MALLSPGDREFFEENGYVKLEGVVPEENCEAVVDAIWDRLGADPDDPTTWYDPPRGMDEHWPSRGGGMVELSHHQSLWDNRQHPTVYQAFAEVLGREALWTSMDRCNMTPPSHPDHPDLDRSFIHWDVDVSDLPGERAVRSRGTERVPYGVQGVLYLEDIDEEQGTFQCVPSLYRALDEWLEAHGADALDEETVADDVVRVPGETGDLVVWDSLLAHGNGSNRAEEPRFAQYITMSPARFEDHEARAARVERWRTLEPFGEDPSGWERRHSEPAELTPLGRKLLGLDPWPGWLEG